MAPGQAEADWLGRTLAFCEEQREMGSGECSEDRQECRRGTVRCHIRSADGLATRRGW